MSGAHTPGPWAYRPDPEYDDWGIVRAPVTEQGRLVGPIICQARDPEALDEITLNGHRAARTDPWEANARLISAAPELLDMLIEVFPYVEGLLDDEAYKPNRIRAIVNKMRRVIAKAETPHD